jgi:hypothetical protein
VKEPLFAPVPQLLLVQEINNASQLERRFFEEKDYAQFGFAPIRSGSLTVARTGCRTV